MYNFDEVLDRSQLSAAKMIPRNEAQQGCVPLWVADMDFPAADEVREALINRMSTPSYGYTERSARYDAASVQWMKQRHRWDVSPEWLVTTPGVVPAMAFVVRALLNPGDKVLIQTPVYHMFDVMIRNNGAEVANNPLRLEDGRFEIDYEDFEQQAKDSKVKLFFLCNPHNPAGRVWKREELQKLADICLAHDVLIFSDDIHHDIVFDRTAYTPLASLSKEIANITITATSPSKTFSLAGFKMGNMWIENEQLRKKFSKVVSSLGSDHLDIGAIEATIAAYTYGEQWLDEVMEYIANNNKYVDDFVAERLPQLNTYALEGTYLKWIDMRSLGMGDKQLEQWCFNEAKVWLNSGYTFGSGGSGFMRMNLASARSVIQEAMERLERAIQGL